MESLTEGEGPLGGWRGLSRCGEGEGSGTVVTGTSTVHHAGLHRLEIILIPCQGVGEEDLSTGCWSLP